MTNGSEAATKQDLVALEERLTERISEAVRDSEGRMGEAIRDSESRMGEAIRESQEKLSEAIHDSETRLLKAFYGFVQTNEKRIETVDDLTLLLKQRLDIVEKRLVEVEMRVNLPPAA